MPESINWTLTVQVGSGLKTSLSRTITVNAYDVIKVAIGQGAANANKVVQVQPGGAGQVQFLLVTSDEYGAGLS